MRLITRIMTWRWGVVGAGGLALAALPSLIGAVPAGADRPDSAADVLARIRASAAVPFQGYAEATGTLAIPDVPQLGDLPALLGGTTRLRAWYAGPDRWRVDTVKDTGEDGAYAATSGTWLWEFDPGRATLLAGEPPVRLPRAADLMPPDLGRRLVAAARPDEVSRLPARRIAGRTAPGVRITPAEAATTFGRIDVWADGVTGLPVRVEVTPRSMATPTLSTGFSDLQLVRPDPARTVFVPPAGVPVVTTAAPDITALVDRFAPYTLPDSLAGQPRRDLVTGVPRGVSSYGQGYALLTVLPLTSDVARGVLRRLSAPPATPLALKGVSDFEGSAISTPLLNAVAFRAGRRYYLVAGPVTSSLLERAAAELTARPPPRRAP